MAAVLRAKKTSAIGARASDTKLAPKETVRPAGAMGMSNSAGGTHRSVSDQLKDAAKELWFVLAPAVAFGTVGGVLSVVIGSLLFEEGWITAVLGVLVMTVTVGYIVNHRLGVLASEPPEEVAEYE